MSNEAISSGDCEECLQNTSNKRNADNYDTLLKHLLVNNDLIIENIFKWLEDSELIRIGKVCTKWTFFAQLIRCKRKYFSNKLLYFKSSTEPVIESSDKNRKIIQNSLEDVIVSYNRFVSYNRLNEFKLIIVFSKLNFNQMQEFVSNQCIPNECTVIHINCRNEVIGSQRHISKTLNDSQGIESEPDFELLSGISAQFMSRALPGIEVNVYKDQQIFDIKSDPNLKCILVFHIWRSLYGHFYRLKTDSECLEYLEKFVNNCDNSIAFGGVTVERLVVSKNGDSDKLDQHLDYVCCLTFSGSNVRAFSYVLDFNDSNIESYLKNIFNELKLSSNPRTESIGFVFDENVKQSSIKLKQIFQNSIELIGCSGISHGFNKIQLNMSFGRNENYFFKKGKCVLVLIQIDKTFE